MKNLRYSVGFTLVEMIVYGAILMSFLGVLTSLFSTLIEMQFSSQSQSSITQDSRYLFSRFSYDIGRASAITLPAVLGESGTSLRLTINGEPHTYSLSNGNLMVSNSLGSIQLNSLGTSVSSLIFRRLGSIGDKQSVQTGFTLTSTIIRQQGVETRSFQSTFSLR